MGQPYQWHLLLAQISPPRSHDSSVYKPNRWFSSWFRRRRRHAGISIWHHRRRPQPRAAYLAAFPYYPAFPPAPQTRPLLHVAKAADREFIFLPSISQSIWPRRMRLPPDQIAMALYATNASTLHEDLTPHGSGCDEQRNRHTVFLSRSACPLSLSWYGVPVTSWVAAEKYWGIGDPAPPCFSSSL